MSRERRRGHKLLGTLDAGHRRRQAARAVEQTTHKAHIAREPGEESES